MASLRPIIDERLASIGDSYQLAGTLELHGYVLGDHEFSMPDGVAYDVVLSNVGEGILVTGIASCTAWGTCDRCLEPARLDLSAEVDEYYLFEAPAADLEKDDDEFDFRLVEADHTIDLGEALLAALVMETPFVVLCREDCAGLCPVCGENLNERDCGHAQLIEERRMEASPFAVLRKLQLDSDEE